MYVGLDNGYGQVKIVLIHGDGQGERKEVVFPAVVERVPPQSDVVTYEDEQGAYLVGDDALLHGTGSRPTPDSRYVRSEQYRIQLLHALRLVDARDAILVTGLPVSFLDDAPALRERILRWRHAGERLKEVRILPQPLGTMYDVSMDWNLQPVEDFRRRRIAIIDIGFGTIDAIEVADCKPSPSVRDGVTEGVSTVVQPIY